MSGPLLRIVGAHEIAARRSGAVDAATLAGAAAILDDIRARGDDAALAHARRLGDLREGDRWLYTPEDLRRACDRLSADFRRQTEALAKAARDRNADTATVAYFQMTVSCVTCHKYLRGRDVVLP